MSLGLSKTKRRIASVKGTEKITKAMELVATVKLKRFRDANDRDSLYVNEYASLMAELFVRDAEAGSHYGRLNEGALPTLYIVISSNMGLCGGYNNSLFKFVDQTAKATDFIAPIGSKATHHYLHDKSHPHIISEYEFLNLSLDLGLIHEAAAKLKDDFNAKKYRNICIIYTRYINSLTFAPTSFQLLPVQIQGGKWTNEAFCPPLFDETPRVLIHRFMPYYLTSVFYGRLVESQLSEQASRRTAMENANDNADNLLDHLSVEYNKARQGAITQEITEVTSGSSASH